MRSKSLIAGAFVLSVILVPHAGSAALISSSSTPPASSVISQPDFSAAGWNGSQDFTDNAGPPAQSFTVAAAPILLGAVTFKGFANTSGSFGGMNTSTTWTLTITSVSGGVVTNVAQEVTQGFAPADGAAYLTIDLDTPVPLAANTQYAFSVYTSAGYFGLAKSTADVLVNGSAFQHGSTGRSAVTGSSVVNTQTADRTFFLTAVPEPATAGLVGLAGMGILARRRRA